MTRPVRKASELAQNKAGADVRADAARTGAAGPRSAGAGPSGELLRGQGHGRAKWAQGSQRGLPHAKKLTRR
jgi:hypothetical protein